MGLFEALFRDAARPRSVIALDLVVVGDLLAGELTGDRLEAMELRLQVSGGLLDRKSVV
jgi:hypothetical protein